MNTTAPYPHSVVDRARQLFRDTWDSDPELIASAPGRVNLIGEHTDYNDGFVLPMAINRRTAVALSRSQHGGVEFVSEYDCDRVHVVGPPWSPTTNQTWVNYPVGVIDGIERRTDLRCNGLRISIASDVPIGSGLSSSAALEAATASAVLELLHIELSKPDIAAICQRAEHEFAGVRCGIMDQMASVLGAIILLDCRSLVADLIALPEELSIVILDSGIPRGLSQSAYNERRGQCEDGVARMQKRWPDIRALRDATSRMLHDASDLLPERVARRCRHVVTENERVLEAAEALRDGDARRFGARMWQSHESMRDDYEISLPEIDRLVERAMATEGCFGARLTGAGFGGAVVALVQTKCAQEFASAVIAGYNEETSRKGAAMLVSADVGARIETR